MRSASSGTRRNARVRYAVYTRKSSEEGLDQEFNSLRRDRHPFPPEMVSHVLRRRSDAIAERDRRRDSGTVHPGRLRRCGARCGREITMLIDGADPSAAAKPDVRLIRARPFNAALIGSDGVPFAALAKREGVSPSYFTRLARLSYLAPDITQAILDGRQPCGLTADKLLAHSRLPLARHEQQIVLGFA
jgi:hypothetical protein